MNTPQDIIHTLFQKEKGILAADEREETMNKRFHACGIEGTEHNRLVWRYLLFSTPDLDTFISGIILSQEVIVAHTPEGNRFTELLKRVGIIYGLKVDGGIEPLFTGVQDEYYTKGLKSFPERLEKAKENSASFVKWRSVFSVGDGRPTAVCVDRNVEDMVVCAQQTLEAGLVPILEPEVLRDGSHGIEAAQEAICRVCSALVTELSRQKVDLSAVVIKMAFVTRGVDISQVAPPELVGMITADTLRRCIPGTLGGIVFLSGGLSEWHTNQYLSAVVQQDITSPVSFSFGRSLQREAMRVWGGHHANKKTAQRAFLDACKEASGALKP